MAGDSDPRRPRLFVILAAADNDVIGRDGDLPWRLPADLARFKQLTLGDPIVMGRRTFESIGRPLPGRRNVVLSRSLERAPDGVELYRSLSKAIAGLSESERIWIIGGADLYREALPSAERVYLTRVHAEVDGDVRFDGLDPSRWRLVSTESHPADERHAFPYSFELWERRS